MKYAGLIACVLLAACSPAPVPQSTPKRVVAVSNAPAKIDPRFDAKFWAVWGDGQAELERLRPDVSRYNQLRKGVAIAIFVTETFSTLCA